ncbi:MAG: universal stress protein [Verrucomicrobiota bacterium]
MATMNTAAAGSRVKTILVPVDFSAASREALRQAIEFAKVFQASVILLHVVEPLHAGSRLESDEFLPFHARLVETANRELTEWANAEAKPHAPTKHFVREGVPYQVIVEMANKTGANLIMLSTHGHTGLRHVLLGSVAEKVVRHAHCPVMVLRQK